MGDMHSSGPQNASGAAAQQVAIGAGGNKPAIQVLIQSEPPHNNLVTSTVTTRTLPQVTTTRTTTTTESLVTTSTDGHLTTQTVTRIIPNSSNTSPSGSLTVTTQPNPSQTAQSTTSSTPSPSSKHSAIIGAGIGTSLAVILIITILVCIKRRRRAREQRSLLGGGTDHQEERPGEPGNNMTAIIPFQPPTIRGLSQHIMLHNRDKLPGSHPLATCPEGYVTRQSMAQTEEMQNQMVDVHRGVDLYPVSTERSETPNPFSDSAVAPESHITPLSVGSDGPSPQFIDLVAARVAEMLRPQDPGIGGARSNMPSDNAWPGQFDRLSQLSRSDRSSTAPPTYATDDE